MPDVRSDVCVVGAGASGMAAAVAAARRGADVVLLDRSTMLGGLGTGAAIGAFCGMFDASPAPRPIPTAFGWSVVTDLAAHGATHKAPFGRTTLVHYGPEVLAVVYDEAARRAGVRVIGGVHLADVDVAGDHVVGATFLSQADPVRVEATTWIDASGDAVLCHRAGVALDHGSAEGQPATLVFRMSGVDLDAAARMTRAQLNQTMRDDDAAGSFDLPRTSGGYHPTGVPGEVVVNMTRVAVDGVDPEDLTRAAAAARAQVAVYAGWLRCRVPGFARAHVSAVAPLLGVRETRRLLGRHVLTAEELRAGRHGDDAVGVGAWPFEHHDPAGKGTTLEWLDDGVTYGVPLDALLPRELENTFVVGRCLSSTGEAHASTRVMGTCFSVGEGAGWLAAGRAADGLPAGEIPAGDLAGLTTWRAASGPPIAWPRRDFPRTETS